MDRSVKSDESLFNILKTNLDYPEFNDPDFTNNFDSIKSYPHSKIQRYDIYAMMIWNFIETMIDYSNKKKFYNSDFYGPIVYWSFLHLKWLSLPRNDGYFTMTLEDHIAFIVDNDYGKHKTYILTYFVSKNKGIPINFESIFLEKKIKLFHFQKP